MLSDIIFTEKSHILINDGYERQAGKIPPAGEFPAFKKGGI